MIQLYGLSRFEMQLNHKNALPYRNYAFLFSASNLRYFIFFFFNFVVHIFFMLNRIHSNKSNRIIIIII